MVSNGVTIVPGAYAQNDAGQANSLIASFFTALSLSSGTYVYNQALEAGADSGLILISGTNNGGRLLLYKIGTPTAGTVTVTVFGRINGIEATIVEITSTIAKTGFIDIVEGIEHLRIGAKISGGGTALLDIVGRFTGNTTIQY